MRYERHSTPIDRKLLIEAIRYHTSRDDLYCGECPLRRDWECGITIAEELLEMFSPEISEMLATDRDE